MTKIERISMKRFHAFGILLLGLILLTGCAGKSSSVEPTLVPTPVVVEKPTYTVQRGAVTRVVQLSGRVAPVQQQDLFFRSDGFVKEVLVASGDTVAEGQVLARLDEPERYQADVAAAELAYAQAQLKVEQTELDLPVQAAKAKIALEQAKTDLEKAQNILKALSYPHRLVDDLLREKYRTQFAISEKDLKDAQERYDGLASRPKTDLERAAALDALIAARRAHYLATINLNWAEGKITQAEIDKAQIEADLAKGNYDKAEAEVKRWQADSPTGDLTLAKLALADAEARLALAKKAQEDVELRAPFDGQVLSLGIAAGSSVKSFQAVLTLADPERLEIQAVPAAEDLSSLGVKQAAVVRLSSQQGQEFTAKISGLPLTQSASSGEIMQDSTVHFTMDDETVTLTLGDAATILVTIDTRENVLWLPPAAIRTFQGENFVFIESGGLQRRVNVTLGLKSTDRVEIASGVEEGQTVVGQ